jgi:hypothetical protein
MYFHLSHYVAYGRIAGGLLVAALAVGVTCPTSAALLLYDDFNDTVGVNLSNQFEPTSGKQWLRPSAPAGAVEVIHDRDVNYPGLATNTPTNSVYVPRAEGTGQISENRIDIPNKPYNRANGAQVFFSFTLEMTHYDDLIPGAGSDTKNDAGAKNTANRRGGPLAGFHGGAASTGTAMSLTTGFGGTIYTRREVDFTQLGTDGTLGTQTGRYEIGITKQAMAANPPLATSNAAFPPSLSFGVGEKVLVVGMYDFVDAAAGGSNDVAKLWINPTPGVALGELTPTWTAQAGTLNMAGTLALESFHIRADNISPGDFFIDNVRIGNDFIDVLPPVPEPSTIVMIAVGACCSGWRRRSSR